MCLVVACLSELSAAGAELQSRISELERQLATLTQQVGAKDGEVQALAQLLEAERVRAV